MNLRAKSMPAVVAPLTSTSTMDNVPLVMAIPTPRGVAESPMIRKPEISAFDRPVATMAGPESASEVLRKPQNRLARHATDETDSVF